jgi:hypothetical protein
MIDPTQLYKKKVAVYVFLSAERTLSTHVRTRFALLEGSTLIMHLRITKLRSDVLLFFSFWGICIGATLRVGSVKNAPAPP